MVTEYECYLEKGLMVLSGKDVPAASYRLPCCVLCICLYLNLYLYISQMEISSVVNQLLKRNL